MSKSLKSISNFLLSFLLGAFVLFWIYRDFDFSMLGDRILSQMDWLWMTASLLFGVLGHVFRGLRQRILLKPLGQFPRRSVLIDSVYVSYALNLVIPRLGEVSRSLVLKRHDNVPVASSLGTVVTERILDTLIVLLVTILAVASDWPMLRNFFLETGARLPDFMDLLRTPWFYVVLFCVVGAVALAWILVKRLRFFERMKGTLGDFLSGITSLAKSDRILLFSLETVLIWVCYFLHFYLTFFCWDFTSGLSLSAGLILFSAGTLAVIVPTPNGAGPWHFVLITLMMRYGISDSDASGYALMVHFIQTLLVAVLGLWGFIHLSFVKKKGAPDTGLA